MSTNNQNPVTLVTGGTFGLGEAITLTLAQRGHRAVAFGLGQPQVSSTAAGFDALQAAVQQAGVADRVTVLEADVSDEAAVANVVQTALDLHGRIDGLVNNAAIGPLGTVVDTDPALFSRIFD